MTQGKGPTFYPLPVLPLWALYQKPFDFLPRHRLGMLWDQPTFSFSLCTQQKVMSPLPKELSCNLKEYDDCFPFASFKKFTQIGIIFSATLTSYTTNLKIALNNWSVLWKQEVSASGNSLYCSGDHDSFSILPRLT